MKKFTLLQWSVQAALLLAMVPALWGQQPQEIAIKKTFKEEGKCKTDNYTYHWKNDNNYSFDQNDPCKVFIGVQTSSDEDGGLLVSRVIDNTPATTYGIKEGDIILSMDGIKLSTQSQLISQRDKHQQGDAFTLLIVRNGQEIKVDARFKSCTREEQEASKKIAESHANQMAEMEHKMAEMRASFKDFETAERDPCKVFIGVYTSDAGIGGAGVRVSHVIDNTPAKASNIVAGDVILALDGTPVKTTLELQRERDKHQPGDRFKMTVLRDGNTMTIKATFKSCDKTNQVEQKPAEAVTQNEESPDAAQRSLGNSVKMKVFNLSPNPTVGLLEVQFEADAVPTTVSITDLTGKVVYSQTINQFSGFFGDQINLDGQAPGNYVLSVTQGEKVSTKKFVLLPRA